MGRNPLNDVTIIITSFLRHGFLLECIQGIRMQLKDAKVIIVDDGNLMGSPFGNNLASIPNVSLIHLPFDSGLSAKRNAAMAQVTTPYVLMGSDDFDFSDWNAREGVERMHSILKQHPEIDLVGGRHNSVPYEGNLEYVQGEYIKEHRVKSNDLFYPVDLTCNYWMARSDRIKNIPWNDRMKIGGEHGDWFLELKHRGIKVVACPSANINAIPFEMGKQDQRYPEFRSRARELGHKIFLEKRGVKTYYGFDDKVPALETLYSRLEKTKPGSDQSKAVSEQIIDSIGPNPKPLIAIIACHRFPLRRIAQHKTWIQDIKGMDYKFFLGRPTNGQTPTDDEVFLDVDDSYEALPRKVQAAAKWALDNGYQHMFKVDDDVYVFPDRLLKSGYDKHDFIGSYRGPSGEYPSGYPSGGPGYWLSARAMKVVADSKPNGDWAEDRFVGNVLHAAGISCHNDHRYRILMTGMNWLWDEGASSIITLCCHPPANIDVEKIHQARKDGKLLVALSHYNTSGSRNRVLIAITSCHKNREFRDAQRETWLPSLRGADYRFFLGGKPGTEPDCVYLDCQDDYEHLTDKTRGLVNWALDNGYTHVFKCDDDTYVVPHKLMNSNFQNFDYVGFARPNYLQGGAGYWLSHHSMEIIAKDKTPSFTQQEDLYVGTVLRRNQIIHSHDMRYNPTPNGNGPTYSNNQITQHKISPRTMRELHERFIRS